MVRLLDTMNIRTGDADRTVQCKPVGLAGKGH